MESKKSLFVSFKKYLLDSEFLPYLPLIQLANLEILENILNSVGQTALPLPHWKKFRKIWLPTQSWTFCRANGIAFAT